MPICIPPSHPSTRQRALTRLLLPAAPAERVCGPEPRGHQGAAGKPWAEEG